MGKVLDTVRAAIIGSSNATPSTPSTGTTDTATNTPTWVGTQLELDTVTERKPNTVYIVVANTEA